MPETALTAALALYTTAYLLSLRLFPYTTCRRCHGTGHIRSPWLFHRAFARCRPCNATGRRPRLGRRITNRLNGRPTNHPDN